MTQKKKKSKDDSSNEEEIPILSEADALLLETIKSQLQSQSEVINAKRISTEKDIKILESIIAEYMSSFVLIGYDMEENRLMLKSARTEKDDDALFEEVRFLFSKLISPDQAPPGL